MFIRFKHSGNFNNTERFFYNVRNMSIRPILEVYAHQGVLDLASATPKDTGLTANSWGYEINNTRNGCSITWTNTNVVNGIPIVILIQYGHGTRGGAYVKGRDFINPAIRPILDKIAEKIWMEVSKL